MVSWLPNIWPNFIGHIIVKPFLCVLYCGLPSLALSPVTSDSLPERCNPLSETISKSAQRKWKLQLKKVPIRKREFTFSSRDKRDFLTVTILNRVKKSTNVPTDEVTTNLKTENGTDFRETNGKHTENHENGTGNNITTHEDKSEVDAEESIDLTDKVRKNMHL